MAAPRARGLLAARIFPAYAPLAAVTLVDDLHAGTVARVREAALVMRGRERTPIIVELRYVADPQAAALIATLDDLAAHDVRVVGSALPPREGLDGALAALASPAAEAGGAPEAAPGYAGAPEPRVSPAAPVDPFGLDPAFRARWIPPLRFLFERYWRIEVTGIEHVPRTGSALVVANHSGAIPVDAFMLATALELRHPERRPLRMLYDKFVDALPFLGPIYTRLGGVAASFARAERLLRHGEVVGLFPEGIAGVEKHWTERYQLRPFKSGAARLSLRTGSPIVPVAIVGAEEAYPVVARLYLLGNLLGMPWIPVTPTFPLLGLAGAVPFPTKWHMHFCPPITPPPAGNALEEDAVRELTDQVREAIVTALAGLLAKRACVFV